MNGSGIGGVRLQVQLGLVGLGWGRRVAEAVRGRSDVRFVAGHARSQAAREAFVSEFCTRAYESYDALLADAAVQGVVIMTPNRTHCALAIAALKAGRHVLVTKPIATTLADAAAMILTARASGRVFAVGHQSRRHPGMRELKRRIDAGELGTLHTVEANTSSPTGLAVGAGDWRANSAECPGGPLTQLGIHYVDNLQHLAGPVRTVKARLAKQGSGAVDPDTVSVSLEFESGATGGLETSYVEPYTRWIRVTGSKGAANLKTDGSLVVEVPAGGKEIEIMPPAFDREVVLQGILVEEIIAFAECIRGNRATEVDGLTGARDLAVVLAAVESHRRGVAVEVDELMQAAGISL